MSTAAAVVLTSPTGAPQRSPPGTPAAFRAEEEQKARRKQMARYEALARWEHQRRRRHTSPPGAGSYLPAADGGGEERDGGE